MCPASLLFMACLALGSVGAAVGLNGAQQGVRTSRLSEECNLSEGEWVRDEDQRPLYDATWCSIELLHNWGRCESKPSKDFRFWRWQPDGCNLPEFNPAYLEAKLRGLKLLMVGDSLMKNHFHSIVCAASAWVNNTSQLTYANRRLEIKALDTVIMYVATNYLCDAKPKADSDGGGVDCSKPDPLWPRIMREEFAGGVVMFTTGHWWGSTSGEFEQHQQPESEHWDYKPEHYIAGPKGSGSAWEPLAQRIEKGTVQVSSAIRQNYIRAGGAMSGHQRALDLLVRETAGVNATFIYQTTTPSHFCGGDSFEGSCANFAGPWSRKDARWCDKHFKYLMREVDTFMPLFPKWRLLDVTHMSKLRPDGHPSTSVKDIVPDSKHEEDCSHFCLGGVSDAWMEVLLATLD